MELMRKDGWSGWKAEGPALLANCPFYRAGYFPARTHGWDATMAEYDRKSEVYEYGYQVGHRALFSLRPGESLVREAGNRGLHVNMETDPGWDGLKARAPENDLVYVNEFLPGYRGGVVANGTHRYAPNLQGRGSGNAGPRSSRTSRPAASGSPALHVKTGRQAGRRGDPDGLSLRLPRRPAQAQGRRPIERRPPDRLDLDQQRPVLHRALLGSRR